MVDVFADSVIVTGESRVILSVYRLMILKCTDPLFYLLFFMGVKLGLSH
jgi:hypothetical protein